MPIMDNKRIEEVKEDFNKLFADIHSEEYCTFVKAEYWCYKYFINSKNTNEKSLILFARDNCKLYTYGEWAKIVGAFKMSDVRFSDIAQDFYAVTDCGKKDALCNALIEAGYIVSIQNISRSGYLYNKAKNNLLNI